jgi:hypothetical protein
VVIGSSFTVEINRVGCEALCVASERVRAGVIFTMDAARVDLDGLADAPERVVGGVTATIDCALADRDIGCEALARNVAGLISTTVSARCDLVAGVRCEEAGGGMATDLPERRLFPEGVESGEAAGACILVRVGGTGGFSRMGMTISNSTFCLPMSLV